MVNIIIDGELETLLVLIIHTREMFNFIIFSIYQKDLIFSI